MGLVFEISECLRLKVEVSENTFGPPQLRFLKPLNLGKRYLERPL